MARVLVLDAYWHKSLAAIRCLGQYHHKVFAGEMTPWSIGFFSKYLSKPFLLYPSPFKLPQTFLEKLSAFILKHHIQVLLPMEESTLRFLLQHQSSLPPVHLPFGPLETINWVRDKKNPLQLAQKLGIPLPKTIAPSSLVEAKEKLFTFPTPLIIKPRISSGAAGILRVSQQEEAFSSYEKVHQHYPLPLIQEGLPHEGRGLGISFLFKEGQPQAKFTHLRLREPLYGGSSTLRISKNFPVQEEMALALLKACKWKEGVAMVEFKEDTRDQKFRLMEINPRYWGSLALAIYGKIPFPEFSVRAALNQPIPFLQQKNGVQARWLIPGDLLLFFNNLKRGVWDSEFFLLFTKKVRYDICSLDDPLPIIGRITSFFPYLRDENFAHLRQRKL